MMDAISNAMGRDDDRRSTIDGTRDGTGRRDGGTETDDERARRGMRTATAVMAVANIVKTSLGPVGLDKARDDEDARALTLRTRREESTKRARAR